MILKRIIYMATVLLIVACTANEESPLADKTVSVSFSANLAYAPTTRTADNTAANAIGSNTALMDAGGFGVFACYTGLHKYVDSNVHPDFMYNEHVTSTDGTNWTYSPLKYWPNGDGETNSSINTGENPHYVSFMAYAPYSDNNESTPVGYCIPSFSHQGELGNPWLTYRLHPNVANQVDLLYASHKEEDTKDESDNIIEAKHPILDWKKPDVSTKVNFVFDHALACVGNKVTIDCSPGLKSQIDNRVNGVTITGAKVEVTSLTIKYTLTAKARLVLWNNGEANWQTIWSEDPICTRAITFIDSNNSIYEKIGTEPATESPFMEAGKGVYYIPIELSGYPQTAVVNLTYRVATYSSSSGSWQYDDEKEGTGTLTLHDYTTAPNDGYKPGRHLYINITLSPMDIALTAAIAPWEEVDPVNVEGEEQ